MKHKCHKRILPMALAAAMVVPAVPAFADDTISPLTSANPTGNVPVELSQAATRFSVSVPTVLPVDVDKDGNVTTASNNRIINHSFGPVEVKDITVEPLSDWKLYDFHTDFSKEKVGHSFGFQVNENNVSAVDGKCAVDNFPVLKGGGEDELTFTYDANMATQRKALSDEQIANVVFKMGWSGQSIKGYEIVPLEDIIDDNGIAQLKLGNSVQLNAIALYSDNTFTWESSDDSIIQIDETGLATALKDGTATVTYTDLERNINGQLTFKVYLPYNNTFANNSWEQIIDACQNNKVPATWAVGNTKPMTLNGVSYNIAIIGKNHDTYADGSGKAPLTFGITKIYGKYQMNSQNTSNGGWKASRMRTVVLPQILSKMPKEVQNSIKPVEKISTAGGWSSAKVSTNDTLFLFSEIEVNGVVEFSYAGEGKQYDYFKTAANKKMGTLWWHRSAYSGWENNFCCYNSHVSQPRYDNANVAWGTVFGFCF